MKHYPYFNHIQAEPSRWPLIASCLNRINAEGTVQGESMWRLVSNMPTEVLDWVCNDAGDTDYRFIWMRWKLTRGVFRRWSQEAVNDFMSDLSYGYDSEDCIEYMKDTHGVIECSDCGEWELSHNTRSHFNDDCADVCRTCIENNYQYSDLYDTYVHCDYARDAIDEEGESVTIHYEDGDYYYDDDRDGWFHRRYEHEDEIIGRYHSSKDRQRCQSSDWTRMKKRFLGVELEVEVVGGADRINKAKELNDLINDGEVGRKVFFENDGSVSNGFEIISQPMGLDRHRDLWVWLKDKKAVRALRSHNTTTCGLHVHISRDQMTKLQVAKMVTFVNDPDNEDLIRAVARRYAEGYCRIKIKKIGRSAESDDRYEAINITPRKTVEFRIFKGSLKYESVIAAIQFANAVVDFCAVGTTSVQQLKTENFLEFIQTHNPEDTDVLRPYLAARLELA